MLSEKMQAAINHQINAELHSAYIYLSMAAYFEDKNLKGFANWMRVQAEEEVGHAMRFYNFIIERRGRVLLEPVAAVPTDWASSMAAFENAFAHEQKISGLINTLMDLALKEKDHAAASFLKWFVDEQVEEEANADAVIQQLKLAGDAGAAIFILDREMATRVAAPAGGEAGGE
jgi:ferritin